MPRSILAACCSILGRLARPRRGKVLGYVDHIDDALIRGWAWDALAPTSRLVLDVFYRGIFLGSARTGGFRQDLFDQKIGDGRHGFVFHVPRGMAADIDAENVLIVATYPLPVRLIVAGALHQQPGPYVDAPLFSDNALRSFFMPLVAILERPLPPAPAAPPGGAKPTGAPRIDFLVAAQDGEAVSPFAAHIALKYRRPPTEEPAQFWRWYLDCYSVEKGAARAPLSAADIQALRRDGWGGQLSTASRYAWAVHGSRLLFVEDRLVDQATRADLAGVPSAWRWTSFAPSRFMLRFRARHHLLRKLPIDTKRDRIAIYAILMLFALQDAHYLLYMPKRWLAAMLEANLFECEQQLMFGANAPFVSKDAFVAQVSGHGFDVATWSFVGAVDRDQRGRGASTPDVAAGVRVDVQMIGPFRQSLGLAESCRRIARALRQTGRSYNFVNYDIGCASALAVPDMKTDDIRTARINVLHLNAEEVPEAMAYLPDVFSCSRTILIPYWELDRLSAVHRLGLDLVDEVWATTNFLAGVFAGSKPVTHIGLSYDDRFEMPKADARLVLERLGVATEPFTFVTTSDALSWTQRKNVLGAIEAFQAAFDDDAEVRLIVKSRNGRGPLSVAQLADWHEIVSRCAADPRITMIDTELSAMVQKALLAAADCLLSLHRAEGLGLDILDALHGGTPVVATAYSGNLDVCNAETAWLVDYDLVPVAFTDYAFVELGHMWAEPRKTSAIAALRSVRHDTALRESKAAAARDHVARNASPAAFAARLSGLLDARLEPPGTC